MCLTLFPMEYRWILSESFGHLVWANRVNLVPTAKGAVWSGSTLLAAPSLQDSFLTILWNGMLDSNFMIYEELKVPEYLAHILLNLVLCFFAHTVYPDQLASSEVI